MSKSEFQKVRPGAEVAFFSDYSDEALFFIEALLSKFCKVSIHSTAPEEWRKRLVHINSEQNLEVGPVTEGGLNEAQDYTVCCLTGKTNVEAKVILTETTLNYSKKNLLKTLFLVPYFFSDTPTEELIESINKRIKEEALYGALIYLGDTYGPRMDISSTELGQAILDAVYDRPIVVAKRDYFPSFLPDVARTLVRILFSFGPPAAKTAVLGKKTSEKKIAEILASTTGNSDVRSRPSDAQRFEVAKTLRIKTPTRDGFRETIRWFRQNPPKLVSKKIPETKEPTMKLKRSGRHRVSRRGTVPVFTILGVLVVLALFPILFLGISGSLLAFSVLNLKEGNFARAETLLKASSSFKNAADSELSLYSGLPIIGELFVPFYQTGNLLGNVSGIGMETVTLTKTSQELVVKILGKEVYDPTKYSAEISSHLEKLYQDTGFLQSEINSQNGLAGKVFRSATQGVDIDGTRAKLLLLRDISLRLPEILGKDKPKKYLVLFQNNMELRPTGGFIGSFAIAKLDSGRLSEIVVQDIYSADGQLKGHVEPPEPIKKHLEEASWYLRDSNWDPDFPTSAARAEWFLGKEINTFVDGVVGIDLEVARSILKVTGPLIISDYSQSVSAENLYEVTQKQAEEEFFPGSNKKASFLTALSRGLIEKLTNQSELGLYPLTGPFVQNLEGRHIQIFLHQRDAQKAISELGFDGSVMIPYCSGNCYSDWLGLAEANLGVNKANYFINRNLSLEVNLAPGSINNRLTIRYENSANTALGLEGRYKTYLRLLLPIGAELRDAKTLSGQEQITVSPDIGATEGRKELGFLIEVFPGQTKSLVVSWSEGNDLDFSKQGEYRLYWRKQAGTPDDPVMVSFSSGKLVQPRFTPEFSLTGQGAFVYNTNLARDLFSRVSW